MLAPQPAILQETYHKFSQLTPTNDKHNSKILMNSLNLWALRELCGLFGMFVIPKYSSPKVKLCTSANYQWRRNLTKDQNKQHIWCFAGSIP